MRARVMLAAALFFVGFASEGKAQDELFERGNVHYQAEEWADAAAAYESVLAGGYEGAELYYNLGNAHFKLGRLGLAILNWERAAAIDPGDEDVRANLELARSMTVDVVEPLPRFWLISVWQWWRNLIPRAALIVLVTASWLLLAGGVVARILGREDGVVRWGSRLAFGSAVVFVLAGANLAVRELGLGLPDRGVVLAREAPVRSAPADDDDLVLFEIHEGTVVRIDRRSGDWAEVVLEDGKVGWVPLEVVAEI